MRCLYRASIFLLLVCISSPLLAQSANISGQVVDPQGAAVKGSTITLSNTDTHVTLSTVSDSNGG